MYEYLSAIPYFFVGAIGLHLFIYIGKFPKKYIRDKYLSIGGIITCVAMISKPFTIWDTFLILMTWFSLGAVSGFVYYMNKDYNVSGKYPSVLTLMENAASNSAKIIHDKLNLKNKSVVVFCGTDTNGFIGLIFARYAKKYGADVSVFIPKGEEDMHFDYKMNYDITKNNGINIYLNDFPEKLEIDIAIDAMVGSDLSWYYKICEKDMKFLKMRCSEPPKKVPAAYKRMVEIFNNLDCKKISLDYPSGIDPKTGKSSGLSVRPEMTIAFSESMKGLDKSNSGEIIVTDISVKN